MELPGMEMVGWHCRIRRPYPGCSSLNRPSQNYSHTLHPAQAAAGLLTRAFIPLWDNDKIAFTVKFLDELCQAIPCHELGFLPEPSIVDFVRNLV